MINDQISMIKAFSENRDQRTMINDQISMIKAFSGIREQRSENKEQ
ncbi:MAG: hypothetical protein HUU54_11130 [Ignavibacteriaceae bacterium]|nr:hypothetical protein [Ignavibacteriaceae bacterium]